MAYIYAITCYNICICIIMFINMNQLLISTNTKRYYKTKMINVKSKWK